jgi:hypothetical protein
MNEEPSNDDWASLAEVRGVLALRDAVARAYQGMFGRLRRAEPPLLTFPQREKAPLPPDLFDLGHEAIGELGSRGESVAAWRKPFREGMNRYLAAGRVRGAAHAGADCPAWPLPRGEPRWPAVVVRTNAGTRRRHGVTSKCIEGKAGSAA